MKKSIRKVILFIIIFVFALFIYETISFASPATVTPAIKDGDSSSGSSSSSSSGSGSSSKFKPEAYRPDKLEREDADEVFNIGEKIYGAAKNIATIVAILTIAVIGLKYMFGSIEQKAEYKTTLVPWFIGAILVVVITRLLGIIEELAGHII